MSDNVICGQGGGERPNRGEHGHHRDHGDRIGDYVAGKEWNKNEQQ